MLTANETIPIEMHSPNIFEIMLRGGTTGAGKPRGNCPKVINYYTRLLLIISLIIIWKSL